MLIQNREGGYTAGPLDVVCLLHDPKTGKYHAAFFEEKPLPGPVSDVQDTKFVRLMCKFHHTEGSSELKVALGHLQEMSTRFQVPPENLWVEPREWDGGLGMVWMVENWRT